MNSYKAKDFLKLSIEELWQLPEEWHQIEFADGVITTHTRATIMSVLLWMPLSEYPDAPIYKAYHFGDRRLTAKAISRIVNEVIWGIHTHTNETINPEYLALQAIRCVNRLYNEGTSRLGAWVASLSLFDALDVMFEPHIQEARQKVEPTEFSIEQECYPVIEDVLRHSPSLAGNCIAEGVRSGTLKIGQVLQCFGPRGFMTDIDSGIFPRPITRSYMEGIDTLHDNMIESRSGTKSLLYNKDFLRGTEYFSRKTQLVAETVQRLHTGDCGTSLAVDYPVMENNLEGLKGKYYYLENGSLSWIRGDEKHLIGTTIRMRSVLACEHSDPAGICSICYGRISFSRPYGTNIGHYSAVNAGDKITSSVLATKHLDSTSRVEKFHLPKIESKYLRYGKEPETLYLRKELRGKPIKLTIHKEEVKNLTDVIIAPTLDEYSPSNASQLTQVLITVDEGAEGQRSDVLHVSLYNRKSSFSREVLEHIRQVKWMHDSSDNVVINLEGFDYNQPLFTLPYKHVNMYEVMKRIQTFLHSGSDSENRKLAGKARSSRLFLSKYTDPVEALSVFWTMLNERLNVNIVHCEVLLYAMMVRSSSQRDYRLPIPGLSGSFEKYNTLMFNRSLSAAMAFESQQDPLTRPGSFVNTLRNDHPYDAIAMGGAVN